MHLGLLGTSVVRQVVQPYISRFDNLFELFVTLSLSSAVHFASVFTPEEQSDKTALPSLAQQLLHQEHVNSPIVSKRPEDISLTTPQGTFNNNIDRVNFDQEVSNGVSKKIQFSNNAADIDNAITNIDDFFTVKTDKILVPAKNKTTKNTSIQKNKISRSMTQKSVEE